MDSAVPTGTSAAFIAPASECLKEWKVWVRSAFKPKTSRRVPLSSTENRPEPSVNNRESAFSTNSRKCLQVEAIGAIGEWYDTERILGLGCLTIVPINVNDPDITDLLNVRLG